MSRIYASKTRRAAVLGVALCAASCVAGCARPPKSTPPPHGPPAAYILVRTEHLSLRSSASLELHAMLATAARKDEPLPAAFEPARAAYARVFADDDDDDALRRMFRGLAAEPESTNALAERGLDNVFLRARSQFAPEWEARSRVTWTALERARAAMDERMDGALAALTKTLGVTWSAPLDPASTSTPTVDLVAESPPAGRRGLLTPFLAARGPCFAGEAFNSVNNARIADCVIVRALLSGDRHGDSPRAHLSERFFTVLVVHAVAAVVTRIEPKHASVDRRAVAAVEPDLLAFLTREWHGEAVTPDLERRYQATRSASQGPATAPDAPASR